MLICQSDYSQMHVRFRNSISNRNSHSRNTRKEAIEDARVGRSTCMAWSMSAAKWSPAFLLPGNPKSADQLFSSTLYLLVDPILLRTSIIS